jgi:hypothetical protein
VAFEERPGSTTRRRSGCKRLDDLGIDIDRKRGQHLLAGRIDEIGPARVYCGRG